MAMTPDQRNKKATAKRKTVGEVELRHRVRPGIRAMLLQLMEWTEDTEKASVMAGCLMHVHSLGPEGAKKALHPRHEIKLSENVARRFNDESLKSILGNPDQDELDQIVPPILAKLADEQPA